MKLPAMFSKKSSVNLLPRDSFESSFLGKVLEWALVFGKWTVILVELVVVSAFLMSFGLDRKLTDLQRGIKKQVELVNSYEQVEKEFVVAQNRINFVKPILEDHDTTLSVFGKLAMITPIDIWYERISIGSNSVTVYAYASSIRGFSNYLRAVQQDQFFNPISIGSLESGASTEARLQFQATFGFNKE